MRLVEFFGKKNSSEIARDRLKLLLVSDRAGCSPELLEMIKHDLIQTLSRYMEVDKDALSICMLRTTSGEQNGKTPALYASIPIHGIQNKGSFTA